MLKSLLTATMVAGVLVVAPTPGLAQVNAKAGPIVYAHHHLNVTNVAEHRRFWIDALGGAPAKLVDLDFVKFPGVLIVMTPKAPAGGTQGSLVNHVGFQVQNLRMALDRVRAAGYPIVSSAEGPGEHDKAHVAFVMGPDDTKVELRENRDAAVPIALDHVHFSTAHVEEMRDWYVKVFGAKPGKRDTLTTAELPGVTLVFSKADASPAATKGRALDHIGFEIRDLEGFTKRLKTMGVAFDRPFDKVARLNITFAFITDPWGTYIELNEGMHQAK